MDRVELTRTCRRFHLDEEVIPETSVHPQFRLEIPYANHGKHVARNGNAPGHSLEAVLVRI